MRPMARIREKIKSDRLFTTPNGSLAAKAGMEKQQKGFQSVAESCSVLPVDALDS